MKNYTSKYFSVIYHEILFDLVNNPTYKSHPRGLKTNELINICIELENPLSNLFYNKVRAIPQKYLAGELVWFFSGNNSIEYIKHYSSFWEKIVNPDGQTLNSSYGNLLFTEKNSYGITEWEWAFQSLVKDKDSRQSLIRFNKPNHSFFANKDFVCALNGLFLIRNNTLFLTIFQRASDIIIGLPFDLPFFTLLQQQMLIHLREFYPNLKLGKFTLVVHSIHLYTKKHKLASEMLLNEFEKHELPELSHNLISNNGKPDASICNLYDKIDVMLPNDNLIQWIAKNLTK